MGRPIDEGSITAVDGFGTTTVTVGTNASFNSIVLVNGDGTPLVDGIFQIVEGNVALDDLTINDLIFCADLSWAGGHGWTLGYVNFYSSAGTWTLLWKKKGAKGVRRIHFVLSTADDT